VTRFVALLTLSAGYSSTGNVMSESSDVIITPPMSYPDLGTFLLSRSPANYFRLQQH